VLVAGRHEPAATPEGGGDATLAKRLANPIADRIGNPLQFNHDRGYGTGDDGCVAMPSTQPVIRISIR
jgi:hypothetical protein